MCVWKAVKMRDEMGKTNAQKKIKFYGPENAGPDNFIYGQGSKSWVD